MSDSRPGINWPYDENANKRSTTSTGKKIWSSSVEKVNNGLAERIKEEKKWRKKYDKILPEVIYEQAKSSKSAIEIAEAGLTAVYDSFTFVRDGEEIPFSEALTRFCQPEFDTFVVEGDPATPIGERTDVPIERISELVEAGEMEPDVHDSLKNVDGNKDAYIKSLQGSVFVLLGATSELCPLEELLQMGLTVVALSRPSPERQAKVVQMARKSPGKLIVPVRKGAEGVTSENVHSFCGADVLVDTPELISWLLTVEPEKRLVVGSYIYLDGGAHVLASLAMDAIVRELTTNRPDTALSYLVSPATVFPVPRAAIENARERYARRSRRRDAILSFLFGPFRPNEPVEVAYEKDGESQSSLLMFNGFANFQGPSYALAKQIQNWRCVIARDNNTVVSANITPPCYTDSVIHVKAAKRALDGYKLFPPLRAFSPKVCANLMAGLLIYDLCCPESTANPSTSIGHPLAFFESTAVHGGLFRCPYDPGSISKAAFIGGMLV